MQSVSQWSGELLIGDDEEVRRHLSESETRRTLLGPRRSLYRAPVARAHSHERAQARTRAREVAEP